MGFVAIVSQQWITLYLKWCGFRFGWTNTPVVIRCYLHWWAFLYFSSSFNLAWINNINWYFSRVRITNIMISKENYGIFHGRKRISIFVHVSLVLRVRDLPYTWINWLWLPPANEVWGKVIFLHQSVILFMGGGLSQCMLGYDPPPQQGRQDPGKETPW